MEIFYYYCVLICVFLVLELFTMDLNKKIIDTANKSWKGNPKVISTKVWNQIDDNG